MSCPFAPHLSFAFAPATWISTVTITNELMVSTRAAARSRQLLCSAEPPAEPQPSDAAEQAPPPQQLNRDGTVYDDVSPPPKRPELSNSMRERLLKEQRSLGADPNAKNPFLLGVGAVALFIALGALAVNL